MKKSLIFIGLFTLAVALYACDNTSNKAPSGSDKAVERSTRLEYTESEKSPASAAQLSRLEAKKDAARNTIGEIQAMIDQELGKNNTY